MGDAIAKGINWVGNLGTGKNAIKSRLVKDFAGISPNEYSELLKTLFSSQYEAALNKYIERATPENKLEILQQVAADEHGVGELSQQAGRLVYVPASAARE